MKKLSTAFFFLALTSLHAQFLYKLDESIPVTNHDAPLRLAWAGGLNAAQYNTLDLNLDGQDDLVIFDRTASKIITFLNDEGDYQHAPEYEALFPDEVANWLLLRDFDGDGKKDIFTGNVFGIRVFRNTSTADELLWEPFYFFSGASQSEVLLTKGLSGMINLQLQFDDLPSITDADGDGDLDIFCMDYGGSGKVEYHQNFSMERHGSYDFLEFELITKSWGGFTECDCADFAFNNEDCGHSGGRVKHQGGKSLLALDVDGDDNIDLLLSEAECDKLSLLPNEGTWVAPVINTSTAFPHSTPAQFQLYPTPYFEDLDFDGIKDLIVSPNLFSKTDPTVNFRESNWFYKNTGTTETPVFQFQKNNYLQEAMIDVGDNAIPAFADLDGDGDLDLFLSTNHFPASIAVYENKGDKTNPSFVLLTNDYLNITNAGFSNLRMQLVDVNHDQTIDLVYTATFNGVSKLYIRLNRAKEKLDFAASTQTEVNYMFSVQENLHLTDVNADGNIDILRGRNTGALEYWRNTGNLNFTLENAQYLNMGANPLSVNPVVSTADLNADGKADLMISDHTGVVRIVSDYRSASSTENASTSIVYHPLTETYHAANLGGRIWPVAANLFNSTRPAIVAGTSMGGLRVLKPDTDTNDQPTVMIFPNPIKPAEQALTVILNRQASLEIFSASGQLIQPAMHISSGENSYSLQDMSQGLYIFRFVMENKTISKRIVIH